MENIFCFLLGVIGLIFRFVGALFYMLWKFELNPVLKYGVRDGYRYHLWNFHLWHWAIGLSAEQIEYKYR